jgi:hypothetical protein
VAHQVADGLGTGLFLSTSQGSVPTAEQGDQGRIDIMSGLMGCIVPGIIITGHSAGIPISRLETVSKTHRLPVQIQVPLRKHRCTTEAQIVPLEIVWSRGRRLVGGVERGSCGHSAYRVPN